MIEIDELTVMQDELRHNSQINPMVEFVRNGGFWTHEVLQQFAKEHGLTRVCPIMEIIHFPDGRFMIHDGHHRAVAIYIGGRTYLRGDEYIFKHWKYEDYQGINFVNRWVTPFDPRTHVRIPDISSFKKHAIDLSKTDPDAAVKFINENKHQYVKPRTVSGVDCIVRRYFQNGHYDVFTGVNDDASEYFRTAADG